MLSNDRSMRALLPLALGFVLVVAGVASAIWLSMRQEVAIGWVRHTLEVENALGRVQILVTDVETGHRGLLITGKANYGVPFDEAVTRLPGELQMLQTATADNPREQAALAQLRPIIHTKVSKTIDAVALIRAGRSDEALDQMRKAATGKNMRQIRTIIRDMMAEEERLLAERTASMRRTTVMIRVILVLNAVLIVFLAYLVVRDGRRRLRLLEATNRQLASEIEERGKAQSQVRQLQKMEAVGQLTGGIAHDFNNMLAIVIGSLDMARRRLTGTEHPGVIKSINNASEGAERAATLTARLLAFSRQQPLEPKVLDTNKLVAGMSELLRRTLGEMVIVETVLAGGLWRVCADPAQIESALVNLAVNARDAMPGGGRLTIETANSELDDRYADAHDEVQAGQYVMLSVSDTGIGMPSEVMERAFDPFYTTKGVGRGTGLGLSQIYGFVKQSNGHVKIYSEAGQGTTVKLYLPRHIGEDQALVPAARAVSHIPDGHVDEIILVVEDEDRVRHMSVDALRELGYTVIQASDGNQALEQIAVQPRIDLLFTDIMMPGMTGRELADRAKGDRPDLKVLYTTGYTRNAIVHNGIVDYGVAFLAKPFSIEALARKIREVLDES